MKQIQQHFRFDVSEYGHAAYLIKGNEAYNNIADC